VPVSEQDMHVPRQAVWQQTPCSQKLLAHSEAAPHALPSGLRPQLLALQTLPAVQSAPVEQVARQLEPPHTYGAQDCMAPGPQLPTPSQRPASVAVEPEHVGDAHAKPGAYRRQAPAPLQEPSVPQVDGPASAHWFKGSWPAATGVHTPFVPAIAQELQMLVQALAQQTPCWQKPLAHSLVVVQSTPFTFLPQMVPLQTLPVVQSLLVAQDEAHWPLAPHVYGSHCCCVPGAQVPAPSQRPAKVAVEPEHVGAMHTVPETYSRQPPLPSQVPSVLQVEAPLSAHWPSGS
jgi:hypothetical protein